LSRIALCDIMPAENDRKWGLLMKEELDHVKLGDWGFYRNGRFKMGELLRKESRSRYALSMYCQVCYLDLNGPQNTGRWGNPQALGFDDSAPEFQPFKPSPPYNSLAPGVVGRILGLIEELNLDEEEVRLLFLEAAVGDYQGLNMPVSPEQAWESVRKALEGHVANWRSCSRS